MKVNLSSSMHRGTLTRIGACTLKPQTLSLGFTLGYDSLTVLRVCCGSSQTDPEELGDLGELLSDVVFENHMHHMTELTLNYSDDKTVIKYQCHWI